MTTYLRDKNDKDGCMKTGPFILSECQLLIDPSQGNQIESWQEACNQVALIHRSAPWWVGDMVNYGEARWGDDFYAVAPESSSLSFAAMERCAAVASRYQPGSRQVSLSWYHHQIALRVKDERVRRAVLSHASESAMDTQAFSRFISSLK